MNIFNLGITELHHAYQNKQLSPTEVTKSYLETIASQNKLLNAFITVCYDEALVQASEAEKQFREGKKMGLLNGIPIAVKDLIYTKGIRTTMGSGVYKDFVPSEDASVIQSLKRTGAVIIGKTNTHELAYGTTGDDSYFGPIKNPYDRSKIAGGSSGGSAAAVAANLCAGALGTDTSGSIRIPASCCGIVGMKPTFGQIKLEGVYPLSWSMDHAGPMTKTVKDNAILYSALTGSQTYQKIEEFDNCTVGIPSTYFFDEIQPEVRETIESAIKLFEKIGARTENVKIPDMDGVMEISSAIDRSEAYLINRDIALQEDSLLGDETRNRILQGAEIRAYEYLLAQKLRDKLAGEYAMLFKKVNFIVTPTLPILPTAIGDEYVEINGRVVPVRSSLMKFTFLTNYIGLPSISIPCGFSASGLPIGIQLIGKKYDEVHLYQLAYALEQVLLEKNR